jgi:alkaline phosphatase D
MLDGTDDDHEVLNDWDKGTKEQPYPTAMDAWNIYAGNHNPSPYREGVHYFSFDRGDTSFFLVDSRAYRSSS